MAEEKRSTRFQRISGRLREGEIIPMPEVVEEEKRAIEASIRESFGERVHMAGKVVYRKVCSVSTKEPLTRVMVCAEEFTDPEIAKVYKAGIFRAGKR